MTLTVSGTRKEYEEGLHLDELIELEGIESPLYVTACVNDAFVESGGFADTVLSDGDVVEFLYFMGGGR